MHFLLVLFSIQQINILHLAVQSLPQEKHWRLFSIRMQIIHQNTWCKTCSDCRNNKGAGTDFSQVLQEGDPLRLRGNSWAGVWPVWSPRVTILLSSSDWSSVVFQCKACMESCPWVTGTGRGSLWNKGALSIPRAPGPHPGQEVQTRSRSGLHEFPTVIHKLLLSFIYQSSFFSPLRISIHQASSTHYRELFSIHRGPQSLGIINGLFPAAHRAVWQQN